MMPPNQRPLHLGVMAKYWEPGTVKTRLGSTIGMSQSARLHHVFCIHLARQLAGSGTRRTFVISPPQRKAEFQQSIGVHWGIELQSDGDLGDRIEHWMRGEEEINRILIGADCPLVSDETIQRAQRALEDHDVVLGPAVDGGYYLIGLRGKWKHEYASLTHEIPWSSDKVYELTLSRAKQAGLQVVCLEVMEDVDTIEELIRLKDQLTKVTSDMNIKSLESDPTTVFGREVSELRDAILSIDLGETRS